jgi:hypothetical protein
MKNFKIIELMELFDEGEVIPASEMQRPQKALDREMFQDANERLMRADGGMLVQPGFGGTRQGYRDKKNRVKYKVITELSEGDLTNFKYPKDHKYKVQVPVKKDINELGSLRTYSAKTKKELQAIIDKAPITNKDYTEGLIKTKIPEGATEFDKNRIKIPTDIFVGEGKEKSRIFKIQNKDGTNVKYTTTGAGGGKKKLYDSIEEVKKAKLDFTPDTLVKQSSRRIKENISEVVYKNKKTGKIVKKYKPFIGPDKVTIEGKGADTLEEAQKFVDDYFKKNPKKIRVADPEKDYTSKKVRKKSLLETDPTGAVGTKKFQYHHIRQIAGGTPLTTDDVMIINQRINSALGTKYNKPLNRISEAIRKNNILALEAMNNKQEGLALEYMKKVDNLNAQAEKIVNSAINNLPKKYKGYVGFNAVELPRDEYGLPIGNEPVRVKKIGGTPVSKDAIDLTTLNLKQEKEFRKIVKAQAERGQTGSIKNVEKLLASFSANPKCRANFSRGGRIGYATGPANLAECAVSGRNRLEKVIKGGVKLGDQEGILARQILKAGRSLGSAFTLSGLFGPAAIAFTAAAEAGFVGYDMLTTGKTFKETIGDSLFNYALGEKTKIDPQKELFKRFSGLGYNDEQLGNFANVLNQTNQLNTILKQDLKVGNLKDQVKAFREQPKDTFMSPDMSPDDEMLQTDQAIRAEQKLKNESLNLDNLLTAYRKEPNIGTPDFQGTQFSLPSVEDTILEDMASGKFQEAQRDLKAANILADLEKARSVQDNFFGKFLQGDIGKQKLADKISGLEQDYLDLIQERGPQLTPFAGGGIAGLSGGIDEGPQVESMNPDSQGLQSLKNRARNI